jgi:hypothetical protein
MDRSIAPLRGTLRPLPRILLPAVLLLVIGGHAFGQTRGAAPVSKAVGEDLVQMRSSPAFAELQLKKTELVSDLESLIIEYTEDFPKVKEIRFMIMLIDRDIARISRVKPAESSKLTLALGKLMVRKIELEMDMWNVQKSYKDEHPDVKRAKRKVEIYEAAINDILN